MQEWEEKIIEKRKAHAEGRSEGLSEGRSENKLLIELVRKKLDRGFTPEAIAELLEIDLSIIQKIILQLTSESEPQKK